VQKKFTYKQSGVDINNTTRLVKYISNLSNKTKIKGSSIRNFKNIGGFGSLFDLSQYNIKNPVLVSSTDGVGTKLEIANEMKKFDTIGIDLVAMCVNDLIVQGAKPLYFLDYIAIGRVIAKKYKDILKGIAKGCKISNCYLAGGETAEMPGMYSEDVYDLAGFAVGVAEKSEMDRVSLVRAGHKLIALPSSGLHSNGFSLARKVLFEKMGMKFEDDFNGKPLIQTLLEPTNIYVKMFKELKNEIVAMAHITGGGIVENLPRVLPENLMAEVKKDSIKVLPIFELMAPHIDRDEMFRAFNMGVGMILVVEDSNVETILSKTDGYLIGEIKEGKRVAVMV